MDKLERRFRVLFYETEYAIVIADEQVKLLYMNPEALKLFGYDDCKEFIGQPVTFLMSNAYKAAHEAAVAKLDLNNIATSIILNRQVDAHGVKKDGTEFAILINVQLWPSASVNLLIPNYDKFLFIAKFKERQMVDIPLIVIDETKK